MKTPRRSPIVMLALPRFRHEFSDLLSYRSTIQPFDLSLIEAIFEQIMWFGRPPRDFDEFAKTARATYYFLRRGTETKYNDTARAFIAVVDQLMLAYGTSLSTRAEATRSHDDDSDSQIRGYLAFYKTMYEALLPVILAPPVSAFAISKGRSDKTLMPRRDGKIRPRALKTMERWLDAPENRLALGLESHVRNAYAHNCYRFLDDGVVELWDVDPRTGEVSWGPEVWDLDKLKRFCDRLWVNALGIICGLLLFKVNNWYIIESRGLYVPTWPLRLRRSELQAAIGVICAELGLHLNKLTADTAEVSMELSTEPQGIDQDEELRLGFRDSVHVYKTPVRYVETRVITQIVKLFYQFPPYFSVETQVAIDVVTWDGKSLGRVVSDIDALVKLNLKEVSEEAIRIARRLMKTDTIGNATTYIRLEGAPWLDSILAVPPRPDDD